MKRIFSTSAEIYVWILPILSVPILYLIKNNFGTNTFIFAVAVHITLVFYSLWLFIKSRDVQFKSNIYITVVFLIMGAALTFISAATFPGTDLKMIAANNFGHYWTSGGFLIAAIISLIGLILLSSILKQRGESIYQKIGFMIVFIGTIMWIIHLSFRLTAMVWASNEIENMGLPIPFYEMSNEFAGFLYIIYMFFTYVGLSLYGLSFLKIKLLPKWLSLLTIAFGLISAVSFVSGIAFFGMPITIQLIIWLIGIYLIRNLNKL